MTLVKMVVLAFPVHPSSMWGRDSPGTVLSSNGGGLAGQWNGHTSAFHAASYETDRSIRLRDSSSSFPSDGPAVQLPFVRPRVFPVLVVDQHSHRRPRNGLLYFFVSTRLLRHSIVPRSREFYYKRWSPPLMVGKWVGRILARFPGSDPPIFCLSPLREVPILVSRRDRVDVFRPLEHLAYRLRHCVNHFGVLQEGVRLFRAAG